VLRNLTIAFKHYNERHPHRTLKIDHLGSSGDWQLHQFN